MSDDITRILLELPTQIARGAKADAAQKGVTLKQWWAEAARARLRKEEPEPAE